MKHALPWAALIILLVSAGCASIQSVPDPAIENADPADASGVIRPQAPAPPDDYRADTPDLIGGTGNPQLVEFFAYWCTTCRFMRPTVHQLEADYWGKLDFVYLDIDNPVNSDAKQEFDFVAQPLFVLLDADGNELQRWYGVVNEEDFRTAFDAAVAG
jgi:thiol-disulfide isomerase/thioredoxin